MKVEFQVHIFLFIWLQTWNMCRNMASFLKFYLNSGWLKSEKSSAFIFQYNLLAIKKKLIGQPKKKADEGTY